MYNCSNDPLAFATLRPCRYAAPLRGRPPRSEGQRQEPTSDSPYTTAPNNKRRNHKLKPQAPCTCWLKSRSFKSSVVIDRNSLFRRCASPAGRAGLNERVDGVESVEERGSVNFPPVRLQLEIRACLRLGSFANAGTRIQVVSVLVALNGIVCLVIG